MNKLFVAFAILATVYLDYFSSHIDSPFDYSYQLKFKPLFFLLFFHEEDMEPSELLRNSPSCSVLLILR